MSERTPVFAVCALLLCAAVLGFAGRDLDAPGPYYDEVIQATPASEFLRDGGRPLEIPGATNTRLFGGWFPLMTQPYMSALKSQLLIPAFAAFGASPTSLRATTLVWGCLGLVLCMLWVRSVWGTGAALLTGALLACDPSFLFVTRHDWGSVSLALICRGGGLWLLVEGWRGRDWRLVGGGFLLGLGVTNKIDAGAFVLAASLALGLAAPGWLAGALRERRREISLALGGAFIGALPMLVTLPKVLRAAGGMLGSSANRGGDWGEKLVAWQTLFDGSYFHRLMLSGGRFDALATVPDAASGWFGWCVLGASLVLVIHIARDRAARRGELFALLATLFALTTLLLIPRAARIHHVMNVMPLPQLLVALAAGLLWRGGGGARLVAAGGVVLALAGHAAVDVRTAQDLQATSGRGRWSDALTRYAEALPADAVVVSLDWGFHAPLVLLRPELGLDEATWRLSPAAGRDSRLRGTPRHVYLVQAKGLEVFEYGAALLRATETLPADRVRVEAVRDRSGAPSFYAVRFARSHTLQYTGEFEVLWR